MALLVRKQTCQESRSHGLAKNLAYYCSTLIPQILHHILFVKGSRPDTLALQDLKQEHCVPLPFIAFITTLIEHSLCEWAFGYHVKVTFEEMHDLPILEKIEEHSKSYACRLEKTMYKAMVNMQVDQCPQDDYNWEALAALANEEDKALEADDEEDEEEDDEEQEAGKNNVKEGEASKDNRAEEAHKKDGEVDDASNMDGGNGDHGKSNHRDKPFEDNNEDHLAKPSSSTTSNN
ncbi:hypothetical protein BT96DRAFT_1003599 [Gymnopus androsaceus JB14]|uniref:DUF6532 domain-containing protein n=1 Tax=Gymnopus androsaceus JB14 TaxID=1447944 RepID=A0A6A4GUN6_9AGAR|nr:hypothetical protein BT96DRAFT_1003599 [Gymnopus androsaceus JB14]